MTDQRPSEVLGALPRTRPQRRSTKRPVRDGQTAPAPQAPTPKRPAAQRRVATARPQAADVRTAGGRPSPARGKRKPQTLRQPPQPGGIPAQPRAEVPPHRPDIVGTAVQAAAELAEIGLALSTRALRRAVARIPRP